MSICGERETGFFYVYMLECRNGAYYTGYTVDMERRYKEHISGKGGARYTRANPPLGIASCWKVAGGKACAMKVEAFIKKRSRSEKEILVAAPETLEKLLQCEGLDFSVTLAASKLSEL